MEHSGLYLGPDRPDGALCRSYLLAYFAAQPIHARACSSASRWSVIWALGTLNNGQRELLGAWLCSIEGDAHWRAIFDNLAVRGVERLRFVVNANADAARATFPQVASLNISWPGSSSGLPPEALGPRLRRVADSTAARAQLMHEGLTSTLRRQGVFECPEAALPFIDAALERRLEARFRARRAFRAIPTVPLR